MAKGKTTLVSPERLELYGRLIATQLGVERKGATLPYTSVNGHMFSFLFEAGSLALRLPPRDREAFIQRHGTRLHEAHGTVMKEYVDVPDELFADADALGPYFRASYTYVAALKPKATRRRV
jgi:hypothetical protein